jgi:hypothetical protein
MSKGYLTQTTSTASLSGQTSNNPDTEQHEAVAHYTAWKTALKLGNKEPGSQADLDALLIKAHQRKKE